MKPRPKTQNWVVGISKNFSGQFCLKKWRVNLQEKINETESMRESILQYFEI